MPTPLIPPVTPPIPRFTPASGALTGPADGDPLVAASVNDPFKQLADRTTLSFNGLYGVYGSRLIASCLDGNLIVLNNQAAVRSSSGILSGNLGSPVDISVVLGAPVANTWYYLYGSDVLGVLTPIISTDPPEATLKYRTSNANQVLISMFRTDGAGAVRPFYHTTNGYQYLDPVNLVSLATALVTTPVPIPDAPPFARGASLSVRGDNDTGSIASIFLMLTGFTPTNPYEMRMTPSSNPGTLRTINNDSPRIPIDGDNGFDYLMDTASSYATINLMGFDY